MTAPVADVLGDVDVDLGREPVCEVISMSNGYTVRRCSRPAEWVARIRCRCGALSLLTCQGCHDSPLPWSCRKCGADVPNDAIGWVKL